MITVRGDIDFTAALYKLDHVAPLKGGGNRLGCVDYISLMAGGVAYQFGKMSRGYDSHSCLCIVAA